MKGKGLTLSSTFSLTLPLYPQPYVPRHPHSRLPADARQRAAEASAHRGGHLRRHRRPDPSQDRSRVLSPGEKRPAARRTSPSSASPAVRKATRSSARTWARRCRNSPTPSRSMRRCGTKLAAAHLLFPGRTRRGRVLQETRGETEEPAREREDQAATTSSISPPSPEYFGPAAQNLAAAGLASQATACSAASSSRSRLARTSTARRT